MSLESFKDPESWQHLMLLGAAGAPGVAAFIADQVGLAPPLVTFFLMLGSLFAAMAVLPATFKKVRNSDEAMKLLQFPKHQF